MKVRNAEQEERGRVAELLHLARDRGDRAYPYVVGTLSGVAIAGLGYIAVQRFNANEDMLANTIILATTMGAKIFRDVRRDSDKKSITYIQNARVGKLEQERIARYGNFDERSALLDNRGITRAARDIIGSDPAFRKLLLSRIETAINDSDMYRQLYEETGDAYYRELFETIQRSMGLYERNLILMGDYESPQGPAAEMDFAA